MAMLATLSAVVLGLLTGSSISSLSEKEGELRSAGVQFIMLDRTLAEYGLETDIDLLASTFSALAFERVAAYGLAVDDAFVVRVVDGLLMPACALT